jgi:hypothetical protein
LQGDREVTVTDRRDVLKGALIGGAAVAGAAALAACDSSPAPDSAQSSGQAQTEQAFKQQQAAVPYPVSDLRDSLERRNVRERLLRFNKPTKIAYIYLLSDYGAVISYMAIKGKVSSCSSQMTTSQLIEIHDGSGGGGNVVVDAPGDDGSYGPNEEGVFFFTQDDVLVQWNGKYLLADAPLKVQAQQVSLAYVDGSKPTSTSGR